MSKIYERLFNETPPPHLGGEKRMEIYAKTVIELSLSDGNNKNKMIEILKDEGLNTIDKIVDCIAGITSLTEVDREVIKEAVESRITSEDLSNSKQPEKAATAVDKEVIKEAVESRITSKDLSNSKQPEKAAATPAPEPKSSTELNLRSGSLYIYDRLSDPDNSHYLHAMPIYFPEGSIALDKIKDSELLIDAVKTLLNSHNTPEAKSALNSLKSHREMSKIYVSAYLRDNASYSDYHYACPFKIDLKCLKDAIKKIDKFAHANIEIILSDKDFYREMNISPKNL